MCVFVDQAGEEPLIFCRGHGMNRYTLTKKLGDGTYGSVVKAVNRQTGEEVAVKKMKKLFTRYDMYNDQNNTCRVNFVCADRIRKHTAPTYLYAKCVDNPFANSVWFSHVLPGSMFHNVEFVFLALSKGDGKKCQ